MAELAAACLGRSPRALPPPRLRTPAQVAFFVSHIPITLFVDSQAGAWVRAAGAWEAGNLCAVVCSRAAHAPPPSSPTQLAHPLLPGAVLPAAWFPQAARDMQQWYFDTHRDPLVRLASLGSGLVFMPQRHEAPLFTSSEDLHRSQQRPLSAPASAPSPQMMHLPTWFKSLVLSEIALQLPFFFVASYAFLGAPLGLGSCSRCAAQAVGPSPARRMVLNRWN